MSVAFIGMAAAFVVMSASARPASASDAAQIADAAPKMIRLTNMPEEVYRHREELEEFVSCLGVVSRDGNGINNST